MSVLSDSEPLFECAEEIHVFFSFSHVLQPSSVRVCLRTVIE
jgi:hypothetical protein